MNPSLKSKLVKRLRELADGAEPADDGYGTRSYGLCEDIQLSFSKFERCFVSQELYGFGIEMGDFAFPCNDWSNDRRTLAGILAAYIETEF